MCHGWAKSANHTTSTPQPSDVAAAGAGLCFCSYVVRVRCNRSMQEVVGAGPAVDGQSRLALMIQTHTTYEVSRTNASISTPLVNVCKGEILSPWPSRLHRRRSMACNSYDVVGHHHHYHHPHHPHLASSSLHSLLTNSNNTPWPGLALKPTEPCVCTLPLLLPPWPLHREPTLTRRLPTRSRVWVGSHCQGPTAAQMVPVFRLPRQLLVEARRVGCERGRRRKKRSNSLTHCHHSIIFSKSGY